ncbi:MAG: phage tail sheath family protein [Microcoleus sp. CSU_2_2]|nr:phage tail sheath family protein [Microcoleus sp. CSU_2_2]
MPITPTYPGVYIEEIPSGVRTITGVATSITAFIGRALRGPVNDPITINSYGDYERIFGGLWVESSMSYAVRDFYLNGGSQAIIVRLYHPQAGELSQAIINANSLILEAAAPGSWGNFLRARIDYDVSPEVAERYDLVVGDLFNLAVRDPKTGVTEEFRNVSVVNSPRQVSNVLANESRLVRVNSLPGTIPTDHPNPLPGEALWGDNLIPTNSSVDATGLASDGETLEDDDFIGVGKEDNKEGLYALKKADLFNLLCIPPHVIDGDIETGLITAAASYCDEHRAMLLIDPPSDWNDKEDAKIGIAAGVGTTSKNAAIFFPRLRQANLLRDNQIETFAPCGAIAGIFGRTDAQRGVWKAPAGLEATLNGVPALSVNLTDKENGELNPLGINCLRSFPGVGRVVWGSRTLQGADRLASEWKYIPVRRLALFLEESLYRGTQWVVFEPNDEPLWAQIRLNIGAFMNNLFRQGAFQGKSPREAYFVKCDKETTTQNDIDLGIVNIIVGFAPLKPAEFVIIKFQQIAGNIIT